MIDFNNVGFRADFVAAFTAYNGAMRRCVIAHVGFGNVVASVIAADGALYVYSADVDTCDDEIVFRNVERAGDVIAIAIDE